MTLEGHLLGADGTHALCIATFMLSESGENPALAFVAVDDHSYFYFN